MSSIRDGAVGAGVVDGEESQVVGRPLTGRNKRPAGWVGGWVSG